MDKRRLERSNTKEMKDWATLPASPKKVVNNKDIKEVAATSEKATTPTTTNAGTKEDDDIPAVAKKYTTKSTFEKQKEEPVTVNKSVMGGGAEDNETSKSTAAFPTTFATTNKSEQQQPLKTTGSMEDRAVEAKRVKEYRDRTKHMITPAHSKDDYSAVPSEADDDDHSFVTRKTDHEFQNLASEFFFSVLCQTNESNAFKSLIVILMLKKSHSHTSIFIHTCDIRLLILSILSAMQNVKCLVNMPSFP